MGLIRRTLVLALCLAGCGFALPELAPASVTFGADLSQIPDTTCTDCAAFTLKTTTGADETGSPVNGILVSARIRTQNEGGIGFFRVLHPTGAPKEYLNVDQAVVGVTPDASTAGHITEVQTHIPIALGDRLGVSFPDQTLHYIRHAPLALCAIRVEPPIHAIGTTETYDSVGCNPYEVLIAGTVEPDSSFSFGAAVSLKNGKAQLPVTVPNAGIVTAGDAAFTAATSAKKRKPLVKSVTATTTAAGTVTLTLKPTSAGRKVLAHKKRLKVSVSVTFTPTGGTAASQQTQVTLKKKKG
jgi:hypothetical protein